MCCTVSFFSSYKAINISNINIRNCNKLVNKNHSESQRKYIIKDSLCEGGNQCMMIQLRRVLSIATSSHRDGKLLLNSDGKYLEMKIIELFVLVLNCGLNENLLNINNT